MISTPLSTLLGDKSAAVHIDVPAGDVARILRLAADDGMNCHLLDVASVSSPQELYELVGTEFSFPGSVSNWDALKDWMADLEWIDNPLGYIVAVRNPGALQKADNESFSHLTRYVVNAAEVFQHVGRIYHGLFETDPTLDNLAFRKVVDAAIADYGPRSDRPYHTPRVNKEIPLIIHGS